MKLLKNISKKIIIIIILISLLITFLSTPSSYAKLDLKDGEFYYSGTSKGTYTVKEGIFEWLLEAMGQIADWLLGIMTLGFRMVVVGWTALIEKILTWALESSSGVNVNGSVIEDTNDLTSLTDSSNNLTVEAIVFNKVQALNPDMFELELDKTISGTGQKLVCKKCGKAVDNCVKNLPETINLNKLKVSDVCSCGCNGCDSCIIYVKQMAAKDPMIIKIREAVATWYNVILLLAASAMLIVLIVTGIKMAISTIASEKALYQRMLVDWVVGAIMIFTLNYFMVFMININEVLVKTIEQFAVDLSSDENKIEMKQLTNSKSNITNSEIEIKVYEEVRSRAYDPKLLNGMVGMVMYMTLVYFAFRYTIIYLKRLLTIIVLTLMAPAVGVAYALQKVFSGKGQALQIWMKEFTMNTLIQTVHALIYAIFISRALKLSLESMSGMIVAFILINFSMKADKLFKKIFNFGGGDSLLGHTENAQEALANNIKTARGIAIGAVPLAKGLTNTPYGKVVKATGKTAVAAAVGLVKVARVGVRAVSNGIHSKDDSISDKFESAVKSEMNENGAGYEKLPDETQEEYDARRASAEENVAQTSSRFYDQNVLNAGGQKLNDELNFAKKEIEPENLAGKSPEEVKQANDNYINAVRKVNRYKALTTPTNFQISKGKINRLLDMENVFKTTATKNPFKKAGIAIFGTTHWDRNNWKFTNDGNGIYNQLSPTNLLGLTDKDKKYLKSLAKDMTSTLVGMGSIFVGMGTIIANPKIGMGLLAGGFAATRKTLGRNPKISSRQAKYKFSRFAPQTVDAMRNSVLARAKYEGDTLLAADIERRHPGFTKKLKNGAISAGTVAALNGALHIASRFSASIVTMGSGFMPAVAMAGAAGYMATKLVNKTKLGATLDDIRTYTKYQQQEQIDEFNDEADNQEDISISAVNQMLILDQLEKDKKKDEQMQAQLYENLGVEVDSNTGELIRKNNNQYDDEEELNKKIDESSYKLTSADRKLIHEEIDNIIMELSKGNEIDMTAKSLQNQAMDMLSSSLKSKGLLVNDQKAEILFKTGKNGLTTELKAKAQKTNNKIKEANKELEQLPPEQASKIISTVATMMKESRENKKDFSKVTADDVISRMGTDASGNNQSQNDGNNSGNNNSNNNGANPSNNSDSTNSKLAITNYLQRIQQPVRNSKKKKVVAKAEANRIKKNVGDQVESARKDRAEKRQQALELYLGSLSENGDNNNDDLLNQLFTQMDEDSVKTVKKVADNTMKKMAINYESARRKAENVRYGRNEYLSAEKKRSQLTLELLKLQKEKLQIDSGIDIGKTVDEINQQIVIKKKEVESATVEANRKGPVVDVDYYVKLETFMGNYKK